MGLKENPVVKRVVEAGTGGVSKVVGQLLSDERFVGAVQTVVSSSLAAKGTLDKSLRAALATMNLPSVADVRKLDDKLDQLERVLSQLEGRLGRIEARLGGGEEKPPKKPASKKKAE